MWSPAAAKLEIFGSSGNGFGTLDSDLDLCMMLEGVTTVSVCGGGGVVCLFCYNIIY